jgi:hypothetical protein
MNPDNDVSNPTIRYSFVAAVPEPSGNLALLALCSTGLLTRRRLTRKA